MDQALLVNKGQRLLDLLDAEGMGPQAALWFYDTAIDAWRLWVVPADDDTGKRDFYRRVSKILTSNPDLDLSTSDVQPVSGNHPALRNLARTIKLSGRASRSVSNSLLDGFYVEDGILLRMEIPAESNAA